MATRRVTEEQPKWNQNGKRNQKKATRTTKRKAATKRQISNRMEQKKRSLLKSYIAAENVEIITVGGILIFFEKSNENKAFWMPWTAKVARMLGKQRVLVVLGGLGWPDLEGTRRPAIARSCVESLENKGF